MRLFQNGRRKARAAAGFFFKNGPAPPARWADLPDLHKVKFLGHGPAGNLLLAGIGVWRHRLSVGLVKYQKLKGTDGTQGDARDQRKLIYGTCKNVPAYAVRVIVQLWVLIAIVVVVLLRSTRERCRRPK